ncbi:MAG: FAD-dependent oxidoreductase [Candidatus Margulisbacteria bacterium]|nr:FAD-dependent oxidoreductase [Candidatus Margulisiibacteriota bacterium]
MDIIIIGGGPAGISAALMAESRGLNVLLIEEAVLCSNLFNVPYIEDLPYFDEEKLVGHKLSDLLIAKVNEHKLHVVYEKVTDLDVLENNRKKIITDKHVYYSKAVIIACGFKNKKIPIKDDQKFYGNGLSYCAPCDYMYYLNSPVLLAGSSEYAAKMALYLTSFVSQLYFVVNNNKFTATEFIKKEIYKNKKIRIFFQHELLSLDGKSKLEAVRIKSLGNNREVSLNVAAAFIYMDIEGNIEFLSNKKNGINLSDDQFIITDNLTETSVAGIYAIGTVRHGTMKRITAATTDALTAVNEIQHYLYFLK